VVLVDELNEIVLFDPDDLDIGDPPDLSSTQLFFYQSFSNIGHKFFSAMQAATFFANFLLDPYPLPTSNPFNFKLA